MRFVKLYANETLQKKASPWTEGGGGCLDFLFLHFNTLLMYERIKNIIENPALLGN